MKLSIELARFSFRPAMTLLLMVLALLLLGLLYLTLLAARSLFRSARGTARRAGHREGTAALRAVLRMTLWVGFFAAFFFAVHLLGRRLGWWSVLPALAGLGLLVVALLRADQLLTVRPGDVRQQIGIGALLALLGAVFGWAIWFGFQRG